MISVWAELSYKMWINTLFNIFVQKDSPDEIYHLSRNRLLFEASHELQCPYVLRPSCSGASTRRGRESLFFVTILYHKANYKKKVLNPRLITKRKKILPSLYMCGFNHVAVCLPQLELVNGMLAEINELK